MSVTQDYKSLTLTRLQCRELIAAAQHRREELQELLGSGLLSGPMEDGVKASREALLNAMTELDA